MNETTPPRSRRKLWPVVMVLATLLALTTWDALRKPSGETGKALRRAASDGDEFNVRRIVQAHPELIDTVPAPGEGESLFESWCNRAARLLGRKPPYPKIDPVERRQMREMTPLWLAFRSRHSSIVNYLVSAGANVNVVPPEVPPLILLAARFGDTNLMALLISHGASIEQREPGSGATVMHYAALARTPEMLSFLIERGLAVNALSRVGTTPLHVAIDSHQLPLVQFLATNGADLFCPNSRGSTPLDAARCYATNRFGGSNALVVAAWLESFAATNKPPANLN